MRRRLVTVLVRGLRRRCPGCGAGGLFDGWFRLVERCPGCGMRLEREEGSFLGGVFLNVCLTQVLLIAWIVGAFALTLPDAPLAAIVAGAVVISVAVPLAFYPVSKTLWAAVYIAMAPLDPEEEADVAAFRFERGDADEPPS